MDFFDLVGSKSDGIFEWVTGEDMQEVYDRVGEHVDGAESLEEIRQMEAYAFNEIIASVIPARLEAWIATLSQDEIEKLVHALRRAVGLNAP